MAAYTPKMEILVMTIFQQELRSGLGDFWQQQAEAELERIKADLDIGEIAIGETGVARNCTGQGLRWDVPGN